MSDDSSDPHYIHKKSNIWCSLQLITLLDLISSKMELIITNGERYRTITNEYFFRNMDKIDQGKMWMQEDGGTCHTTNGTIDLLQTRFGDELISRNRPVKCPSRFCDLTPLDTSHGAR